MILLRSSSRFPIFSSFPSPFTLSYILLPPQNSTPSSSISQNKKHPELPLGALYANIPYQSTCTPKCLSDWMQVFIALTHASWWSESSQYHSGVPGIGPWGVWAVVSDAQANNHTIHAAPTATNFRSEILSATTNAANEETHKVLCQNERCFFVTSCMFSIKSMSC